MTTATPAHNASCNKINASISPGKIMSLLSPSEVNQMMSMERSNLYSLFRRCTLAVLNSGTLGDDAHCLLETFHDYDIEIVQQSRGIKLALSNAPAIAFVEEKIIAGIREHLFSVVRDVSYMHQSLNKTLLQQHTSDSITHSIFKILRNAALLKPNTHSSLVVCWGGHSISRTEYDYTKQVGYELGLRGLNIGTGCGPGAMKGPMKGATIGHAKQHIREGRYIGLTEPDIIAAEPPNPIVNELVILPDIEKRLEAFVRTAHGIIVFPGGVGTAEEILYLLGILSATENRNIPFPLIFTAPDGSADYFVEIDTFLKHTFGPNIAQYYDIIIGEPSRVASSMLQKIKSVMDYRRQHKDAYYFNWLLKIPFDFQTPFEPTHENMAQLTLNQQQNTQERAANLRRIFSGIVAGNVKASGIQHIQSKGPYQIHGEPRYLNLIDQLLRKFITQGRMKLGGKAYTPCYEVIQDE